MVKPFTRLSGTRNRKRASLLKTDVEQELTVFQLSKRACSVSMMSQMIYPQPIHTLHQPDMHFGIASQGLRSAPGGPAALKRNATSSTASGCSTLSCDSEPVHHASEQANRSGRRRETDARSQTQKPPVGPAQNWRARDCGYEADTALTASAVREAHGIAAATVRSQHA